LTEDSSLPLKHAGLAPSPKGIVVHPQQKGYSKCIHLYVSFLNSFFIDIKAEEFQLQFKVNPSVLEQAKLYGCMFSGVTLITSIVANARIT